MNNIKRIGFACKYMHPDQSQKKKLLEEIQRPLNTKSTTVQWLNRQTRDVAEQRLWDIMVHNIQSYYKLIEYVGSLPHELRMVRLGSDVLPVYTQPDWSYFWKLPTVVSYCEQSFARVGELALVLDVHHHWCREGEYIRPTDDRYKRVIDSWRGVRPVIHYSYSREEWVGHIDNELPNMQTLLESGTKKAKLRAHSDWYPNRVANEWALEFLDYSDIMCESKMKNLASIELYKYSMEKNNELFKQDVRQKVAEPDPIII
jgi:UV DNA damage repair endonuclease